MVKNKIDSVIQGRNYALPDAEKLVFRQLFFFTYRDNAPMVSYGGFLDLQANEFDLTNYNLNIFEFIKTNDERYIIDPPLLTYKEVYLLNSHLPNSLEEFNNEAEISFIPESERNKYKKLYKYLPNYMDVVF
jgi:hypothetical protein